MFNRFRFFSKMPTRQKQILKLKFWNLKDKKFVFNFMQSIADDAFEDKQSFFVQNF